MSSFRGVGLLVLLIAFGSGLRADTLNPYTDVSVAGLLSVSLDQVSAGNVPTGENPADWQFQFDDAVAASGAFALGNRNAGGTLFGGANNEANGSGQPLVDFLNDGGLVRFASVLHDADNSNDDDNVNFTSGVFDVQSNGIVGTAQGDLNYVWGNKFDTVPDSQTGFIELNAPVTGNLVVSLKAAGEFALFLLTDLIDATHVYFDTSALSTKSGSTPNLSHSVVVFTQGGGEEIPEPGQVVGWLSMAVTGAVVFWFKRKRANALK